MIYTVIPGDRIRQIASRWGVTPEVIVSANAALLRGRGISRENLPIIFTGDRLTIPLPPDVDPPVRPPLPPVPPPGKGVSIVPLLIAGGALFFFLTRKKSRRR